MCGRFTITKPEAIKEEFDLREELDFQPRYNISPTQNIPVIISDRGYKRLIMARWGLVPAWAKDEKIAFRTINARAETLAEKPAFREAYRKRRCLIPADGFFEWKKSDGAKQPFYIRMKDKGIFSFAGLWEEWREPEGRKIISATIITTGANSIIARIHERMPLIVPAERRGKWLDPVADPIHDLNFTRPYDPFRMITHPVSRMVNDASNDAPGCIRKVG